MKKHVQETQKESTEKTGDTEERLGRMWCLLRRSLVSLAKAAVLTWSFQSQQYHIMWKLARNASSQKSKFSDFNPDSLI